MTGLHHSIAGIAATAVLAAGVGLAEASPSPSPHVVYGCQFSMIWLTPGHHPVGFIGRGTRFEVTGYSPSRRWALGTTGWPGMRHRSHGWVRRSGLCRTRPA